MKTSDAAQFWTSEPVPEIPARNRLYSPEPIGIGTAQVESLTSYMCRLAQSHCLSAGSMFLRMGGPSAKLLPNHLVQFKTRRARCRSLGTAHALNGLGAAAEDWSKVLGELTGRASLPLLTLLPMRGVLAGNYLLRSRLAWCPSCFALDRHQNIAAHNRLLWSFKILPRCLVHRTHLSDRCPECNETQSFLSSFSLPGYCSHCAKWMGHDQDTAAQQSSDYTENDFAEEFISKLLISYRNISLPYDLNPRFAKILQANLHKCIDRLTENKPGWLAKVVGLDQKAIGNWHFGVGSAFPIESLLKVGSVLGLSADSLVAREITESEILEAKSRINIRTLIRAGSQIPSDVLTHLVIASRSDECPSLQQVAERIGYKSIRTLRKVDASLCRLISSRHAEWRREMHLPRGNRRKRTDKEIHTALEKALASTCPPTIHSIAQKLGYQQSTRLYKSSRILCEAILKKRRDHELEVQSRNRKLLEDAIHGHTSRSLGEIREKVGEREFKRILSSEQELIRRLRVVQEENQKREMRAKLERALSETPPPSFCAICERLGVDGKTPRVSFPDLSRAIINRAKAYRSEQKARRISQVQEEVLDLVSKLRDAGIAPMHKTILPMVSSAKAIGFVEIGRAVVRARRLLGLPRGRGGVQAAPRWEREQSSGQDSYSEPK